jgi:excisionase family DNA binding protein
MPEGNAKDKRFYSAAELASYLGRSLSTIYRIAEKGEIPSFKRKGLGLRFSRDEVDKWLEEGSRKPPAWLAGPRKLHELRQILNPSPASDITSAGGVSEMARRGKINSRLNLGNGAVYPRKTKKGLNRWYLDYRDRGGKRVQKLAPLAATREDAALALLSELKEEFLDAYGIKDEGQPVRFGAFVTTFIEDYSKVNKLSWKDDKCRLQKLAGFFGDVLLSEITPCEIEKFKATSISRGLTKSTVNRYLAILRRMFNVAITWGKARENPVRQVKLYSEKDNLRERILSPDEEIRLLKNSPDHLAPILIVALNTGMRRGEILNLKWEQIDLKAREIRVERTKSGKPRVVDINSRLFEFLTVLRNRNGNATRECVFPNPKTGKPYGKLQKSFGTACRRARISGITFHTLRHTFGSRLIERGADIIRVKELMGHSTVRVTERYLHSNREARKQAVELLCQGSEKSSEKPSGLLHRCDGAAPGEKKALVASLFSVN